MNDQDTASILAQSKNISADTTAPTKVKLKEKAELVLKACQSGADITVLEGLLDTDPITPKMMDQIGRAAFKMNALEVAERALEQAFSESDYSIGCIKSYGMTLAKTKRIEKKREFEDQLLGQPTLTPKQCLQLADLLARQTDRQGDALALIERVKARDDAAKYTDAIQKLEPLLASVPRTKSSVVQPVVAVETGSSLGDSAKRMFSKFGGLFGSNGSNTETLEPAAQEASQPTHSLMVGLVVGAVEKICGWITPAQLAADGQAKTKAEALLSAATDLAKASDPSWQDAARVYADGVLLSRDMSLDVQKLSNLLVSCASKMAKENESAANELFEMAMGLGEPSYKLLVNYGNFNVKREHVDAGHAQLLAAGKIAAGKDSHVKNLISCMAKMDGRQVAYDFLIDFLEQNPAKKSNYLLTLADLASGLNQHKDAAAYLDEAIIAYPEREANFVRRKTVHNLRAGVISDEHRSILDVCQTFFQRNLPILDDEQSRILEEIVDKGYCMSHFDDLFGETESDLWRDAENFVQDVATRPDILDLQRRISECEDFNSDPHFQKMFKPSIINYRQEIGEMFATEAPYQLYLNKRILDIANSYNEMLSKIRNVALWINPPISGKNVGERKGSQIWHRDQEDVNILKCFIYYSDITEDSGATEYIPYSKSEPVRKYTDVLAYPSSSGYPGDFLVNKRIEPSDMIKAEGRKGSIMFFDTNGFHRGGYVTGARRILTMSTFLRPVSPYAATNTKLSTKGADLDAYPFESSYALQV